MGERANCETCNEAFDRHQLRPYGPGGSLICHPCGMKPENKPAVEAALRAVLTAPGHSIQTPTGIVKSTSRDPVELIQQVIDLNNPKPRH